MASIAGTNVLYPSYRNSVVGKTSDYSTRVDADTDTLFTLFEDNATAVVDTDIFWAAYTAGEAPTFANRLVLTGVTAGTLVGGAAATGTVDAVDSVFTGASAIGATATTYESLIVAKFITNAAASPLLSHYGSATGLPLTPNGADITVVWNSSGLWRY